jgi:D-alanyl-D-alanine carboxypeptidase (penicillin-binding protein 5/6)
LAEISQRKIMKRVLPLLFICVLVTQTAWAGRAKVDNLARDPYASALLVDADTGKILFEDHAETSVYPASVLKLMVLLVLLERIEQGALGLEEMVQVTGEAARMGGSQVYLDPKEQFSVEDLIYALTVQSANDASVALATHVAGSPVAFIALMNRRAEELGMKDTHFYSVHGLPPAEGQKVDETTAKDLSILARELAKRPETFKYTSTRVRDFRDGKFVMRTHNHLLANVGGCDGFKTGYFKAAGFSIVATAKREGVRIIAIVMGSKDRKVRDAKAAELLATGFAMVPPRAEAEAIVERPEPVSTPNDMVASPEPEAEHPPAKSAEDTDSASSSDGGWSMFFGGLAAGLMIFGVLAFYISRKRSRKYSRYLRKH